ncbi:hypothetical protein, partial [Escherichia coli]|uniref:hypothetical protein n=1 Tax=Escherichia coli TaxID=562 RepID=UPI00197BB620
TDCPLTDFRGKTSIFSHPVYLFLRKFSLQDSRGGSLLHLGKMSLLLAQNLPHSVKKRKRFQGRLLQQVILRKPDRDTLQTPAGLQVMALVRQPLDIELARQEMALLL